MNIRITSSTTLQQIIDQMTPNLVAGYGDMSNLVGQVMAKLASQDASVIDLFASSGLARAALAAAYNWRTDGNLISDVTTKLRFATYTASSGNQYAAARWGVSFLQYGQGDANMVIARQNETQIAKQNAVLAAISYPIVGRYVNPEYLRAAGSGLLIGAKGTVNGLTTSVANLFKLGFAGDLHPWAPTQDDIANGYSTSFVWGNVAGELLLTAATMGLSQAACAPGRVSTLVRWTNRGITVLNLANTTINGGRAIYDISQKGITWQNGLQLGLSALNIYGSLAALRGACFTAEMMVETRRGLTRWDCLTLDDDVASCAEHDPHGPIEFKPIEALLKTRAVIWHVHVDGQVIRTTQEHPFYVWDKGWVAAKDLLKGDLLRRKDGSVAVVEEVFDTGVEETVYNCSVAEYHTYFVGGEDWGFSVWAHNTCTITRRYEGPIHHLASDKSSVFTPLFRSLFDKAGLSLQSAWNRMRLPGHVGPHGSSYNQYILKRLRDAVDGTTGAGYRRALIGELRAIRREIRYGDLGDLLKAAASRIDRGIF
jgi:hypothetical protein